MTDNLNDDGVNHVLRPAATGPGVAYTSPPEPVDPDQYVNTYGQPAQGSFSEQAPRSRGAQAVEPYDPEATSNVDDVKAYVEANPSQRDAVLAHETSEAGKNRVTLVEWLESYEAPEQAEAEPQSQRAYSDYGQQAPVEANGLSEVVDGSYAKGLAPGGWGQKVQPGAGVVTADDWAAQAEQERGGINPDRAVYPDPVSRQAAVDAATTNSTAARIETQDYTADSAAAAAQDDQES